MAYSRETDRYDRWGGRPSNPFDDFGEERPRSQPSRHDVGTDYDQRMQAAYRKMEESSASSLRVLNETTRMGIATTEELETQAEAMDRTERRLDEIHQDVDKGKKNMRLIKSPFGGIANYFSKKKPLEEVTDPKYKTPSEPKKSAPRKGRPQGEQQRSYKSTGSAVADRNLDEMDKALQQLKGVGDLISYQLDDSNDQIERVAYKVDREDARIKALNKDIKGQL